jgi:hypothetical protein
VRRHEIPLRHHIPGAGLAGETITTPIIWVLVTHRAAT